MTEKALAIEGLSFSRDGRSILRDVSVAIGEGERWSIVGPNGAGKSSLLKCLVRIHTDWSGRVRLHGRPLESYKQRELARMVAYVPQGGIQGRFPYTTREFVEMARYPHVGPFGTRSPGDEKAVEDALARAGVRTLTDRILETLSGGERQKVSIAAALAQGGDLLLLDEPTAFLDYRQQSEVHNLLDTLHRESGITIVTVTHDINAALRSDGNVMALRDGAVAYAGHVSGLVSGLRLEEVFGTRFIFLEDPETGLRVVAPGGAVA